MIAAARRRYLDILASVYIYNEHRGYSSIDRLLAAVRSKYPLETGFIGELERHRRDERQHYLMFRRYFEALGTKPFRVDNSCGHIDRLVRLMFGSRIDALDTDEVIDSPELFFKLCRVVMLTEMRGMRQVAVLLRSPMIRSERQLMKIFKVIERDEPSHWMPYLGWLRAKGARLPNRRERIADAIVHRSLIWLKLPLLYLDPLLQRRSDWYDDGERAADLPLAIVLRGTQAASGAAAH